MRRLSRLLAAAAALAAIAAPTAQADFGFESFDIAYTNADGSPVVQAGAHPFAMTTRFKVNTKDGGDIGFDLPDEAIKDALFTQVEGFIGKPTAAPRCSSLQFLAQAPTTECADSTAMGIVRNEVFEPGTFVNSAIWNLEPPPGMAARLGFWVNSSVPVVIDLSVRQDYPYNVFGGPRNISQLAAFYSTEFTLWGNPADPAHDIDRGHCSGGGTRTCPANIAVEPFLTVPRSCEGPLQTRYEIDSWANPGKWLTGAVLTRDAVGNPQGFLGCGKLGFSPEISAAPTTDQAETGSGLDFELEIDDEGLANPTGIADSDIKRAEVTLPEGVTINPSVGERLGDCSPAELDRETLRSPPGEGCPSSSKIGTVSAELPIIEEPLVGSIFLAEQDDPATEADGAENPFDSLIALYFVLKNPTLGAIAKLAVEVEPDPETGQLVAKVDDIPQFPISRFSAHLRAGARSALVTPGACGTYTTKVELTPWANPDEPLLVTSSFEVASGVGGGPCPKGGVPPFEPGFSAGSLNNNAGSFSPFLMRLTRRDGEQDMTKFSSVLPPGVLGSLAGVGKCPDVAVAIAKSKTGREELAAPSCPASSAIGRTLAGAGVGAALTYVPGAVYLAGPYRGAPLSVISITPAVAGPFDAGTVVVRLGLTLNPRTAEVEVDGAASDPIPHILQGIVLKVRDLRVYVDRPGFTLNPTDCEPSSAKATLFGSFLDVIDPADDRPAALASRYQAANCASLPYRPRLSLKLVGGTRRGAHPGLRAVYRPRPGDANVEGMVVRLPRSAFLDQGHIRTICTRVQFAADACPKGAQYGYIRAWTPLLDEPLQGPVYLRSSNNKLPDLIFDLQGIVDIEVATRIDSARGGIRANLSNLPDAPISVVVLRMQGGKKGLIVNSRNLCAGKSRANVRFNGQNGKRRNLRPVMRAVNCKKRRKAKRSSHGRAQRQSLSGLSAVR